MTMNILQTNAQPGNANALSVSHKRTDMRQDYSQEQICSTLCKIITDKSIYSYDSIIKSKKENPFIRTEHWAQDYGN